METRERIAATINGWPAFFVWLILLGIFGLVGYGAWGTLTGSVPLLTGYLLLVVAWVGCAHGFFTLQPNEGAALILFGRYMGTVKTAGLHWTNPLYLRQKISLRCRNFDSDKHKVNDLRGNPIEIGAIIVWHVSETAKASFDVDDYVQFVEVQSESALRHLAMSYPYDTFEEHETMSLRGSPDEISQRLQSEVQERVAKAGVLVDESRLSHLAYAPEIAQAMLQRQQAEAVVAARTRIVEGAVGMVEMAIAHLEQAGNIELDDERRAAMVGNLMVVLCGHENARPVINAGTLYPG